MHPLKLVVGFFFFFFLIRFIERPLNHALSRPPTTSGGLGVHAGREKQPRSNECHETHAVPSCASVRMLVVVVVGLRDTLVGRVISRAGRGVPLQSRCGRLRFRRGGFAVICLSRRHR